MSVAGNRRTQSPLLRESDQVSSLCFASGGEVRFWKGRGKPPRKDRDVTIELGLLLLAYDVKERNLAVLVSALLAGSTPAYFPIQMWQRIAWLALEETASFTLRNDREWRDAYVVLQEVQDTVAVVRNCVRSEEHGSMNATKSSGSCGGRVA